MFANCTSLSHLDLSWIQSTALNSDEASGMFWNCPKLKTIKVDNITNWRNILPGDVRDDDNNKTYERVTLTDSQGAQFTTNTIPDGANTYTINRTYTYPLDDCSVNIIGDNWLTYTGQPLRPKFSVSIEYNNYIPDQTLKEGVDYTIQYRDNTNPGEATAIIEGKGRWVGERVETFWIEDNNNIYVDPNNNDIANGWLSYTLDDYVEYTGSEIRPSVSLHFDGKTLTQGVDYTVEFRNNVNAGTATIVATGKGKYRGTLYETFSISKRPLLGKVSFGKSGGAYTFTGKAIKPSFTIKVGGRTLRAGTDYTASYRYNKNIGTGTAIIEGKGNYAGTTEVAFKIVPKGTSVKKLAKGKKSFTVTWKKPSKTALKQTTGYQVRWSLKSSMKGAKSKTVKASSAAGKKCNLKVSKLKGGKKYYVQVRTYKKVGGKAYYSAWSKAKTVKVRK